MGGFHHEDIFSEWQSYDPGVSIDEAFLFVYIVGESDAHSGTDKHIAVLCGDPGVVGEEFRFSRKVQGKSCPIEAGCGFVGHRQEGEALFGLVFPCLRSGRGF